MQAQVQLSQKGTLQKSRTSENLTRVKSVHSTLLSRILGWLPASILYRNTHNTTKQKYIAKQNV